MNWKKRRLFSKKYLRKQPFDIIEENVDGRFHLITDIGGYRISTVELMFPIYDIKRYNKYETMIFMDYTGQDIFCTRCDTKGKAITNHKVASRMIYDLLKNNIFEKGERNEEFR